MDPRATHREWDVETRHLCRTDPRHAAGTHREAALTEASASSLGAARFNFTGVAPTGDKGGDLTGPKGLFLCVKSWFCLVSLLPCSILLFVGKLEDKTRGETLEEESDDFLKVLLVALAWGGGLSRSLSPFSVFFTFMLVLVELPSNTMRGLFRNPSAGLLLKSEMYSWKVLSEWQTSSLELKAKMIKKDLPNLSRTTGNEVFYVYPKWNNFLLLWTLQNLSTKI